MNPKYTLKDKVIITSMAHGHKFAIGERLDIAAIVQVISNPEYTCRICGSHIMYNCSDGKERSYLVGECEIEKA